MRGLLDKKGKRKKKEKKRKKKIIGHMIGQKRRQIWRSWMIANKAVLKIGTAGHALNEGAQFSENAL